MPDRASHPEGDTPERARQSLGPERLRLLLHEFEVLRGTALALGDIEDGTDSSVGVGVLLDDCYAHVEEWQLERVMHKSFVEHHIAETRGIGKPETADLRAVLEGGHVCSECGHDWRSHDEMGCNECPRVDLGDGVWANHDCEDQQEVIVRSFANALAAALERLEGKS